MNLRVLGVDVSKSSVSVCLLTEKPKEPRKFYHQCVFYCFKADASGIKALLQLKPDLAIMEPTGVNYSKLWGTHLARAGVEVRLVGHQELRSYRTHHLALPDKDDDADALALACYAFDYLNESKRFVQIREPITTRIRELVLRLAHLNRVQSPVINRLRQDLAWQFPEVAKVKSVRYDDSVEMPLLWGWLAQERNSKRYDELYKSSCGLGLTSTVRNHAKRLCELQREEREIEIELKQLVCDDKFSKYHRVFTQFGFGLRTEAIIISQIYPIQAFLDSDGQPEIAILRGRTSGKTTRRHLSERRFQKALGVAPSQNSSGDKRKVKVVGGSDICRKALWLWVFVRIEVRKNRLKNNVGKVLGDQLDLEKSGGKPVKLVRSRISSKAARLLFHELVKELCPKNV